jgi:streptomycin 6-kinase
MRRAIDVTDWLLALPTEQVLLHGDLHPENVLRSGTSWLAIDPKPLVGDRAFDLAQWLANWSRWLLSQGRGDKIEATIERFSDLAGVDKARAAGWAFVNKAAWGSEVDVAKALLRAFDGLRGP